MPAAHPSSGTPCESSRFGRERDARVCWLLGMHPVTAAMLAGLGWFPTKTKALRRLRRLVQRRRIRFVGTVRRRAGRPEHVFCRYQPKANQLLHEVELTEVCLRLDAGEINRGLAVADHEMRPDAVIRIRGVPYYLELDRGTTGTGKVGRERFSKYAGCPDLCLWICPTDARRDRLRSRAQALLRFPKFRGDGVNGVDSTRGVHRWLVSASRTRPSSRSRPSAW